MNNSPLLIILLEDDEAFAQAMERSMTRRGHTLHWTSNSRAFIEALNEGIKYDLVLMDLKLQDETSLAFVAQARQSQREARIIMITGYASIATTVEAIKQGADDYLPKPLKADDILRSYYGNQEAPGVREDVLSPKRLEWEHIQRVLLENEGNISKTAEQLGMHRRTLQRKLQKKPKA